MPKFRKTYKENNTQDLAAVTPRRGTSKENHTVITCTGHMTGRLPQAPAQFGKVTGLPRVPPLGIRGTRDKQKTDSDHAGRVGVQIKVKHSKVRKLYRQIQR